MQRSRRGNRSGGGDRDGCGNGNGRGNGHGCGHSALGTAAVGAALAVKAVYEKHKLPGTIRVYGTPAEETLIGKVYMALDGRFDGLDACLHWHPGTKNKVWAGSSKARTSLPPFG